MTIDRPPASRLPLSYVLPIRRSPGAGAPESELTAYLRTVASATELIVVDGSPEREFAAAHDEWRNFCRHVPPSPNFSARNGKVRGVITGLHLASHEALVIADDDVRYEPDELARMSDLLAHNDLVIPQNFFDPKPWHVHWDTARTCVNRAFGHDYPGTLGVRVSVLARTGGYDGDVLFENLELIRTVRAVTDRIAAPADFYVKRLPATSDRFFEQRVRQAYDDLARPVRFGVALSVLPATVLVRRQPALLAAAATAAVMISERGRRRGNGGRVFSRVASALAPAWWLERSVLSWIALGFRLTGGCRYAGARLLIAAHRQAALDRAMASRA